MHEILEAHHDEKDWEARLAEIEKEQGKMFAAERDEYGEIIDDAGHIFRAYLKHWDGSELNCIPFNDKLSEHWIEVELPRGIILVMKIDAFAEENDLTWIVENKTGKSIPDEDQRWRNLQTAVYLRACELAGFDAFDGILWNFILSKRLTRPEITKRGQMSIKRIVTLPSVVREVIEANDMSVRDTACKTALQRSEENVPRFFQRVFTPRNEEVIDLMFADFLNTNFEMKRAHVTGQLKPTKNIDRHCSWCDYEPLCRAQLTGGDVDFVKEREFTVGKKGK